VTVLSADDPVRVFQQFATLDLISSGRAEIIVGRGSFVDAYPLFGYDLNDYDDLFVEKLDLLLKIREKETITWKGKFRPALYEQSIYPRPQQSKIPIWLGVGGTPQSFARAGRAGTNFDGSHHWWRNASIQTIDRFIQRVGHQSGTQ